MDLEQSNPAAQRLASALWSKGRTKIKAMMALKGTWGKDRTRSIFGNQFGKGDLMEDMPDVYLDRIPQKIESIEDDVLSTARSEASSIVGWTGDNIDDASNRMVADAAAKSFNKKGYKTNVRASILKVKKAAKKVRRFLNVVRLAHDPTSNSTLSYNQVLAKLREHYDPDGIHSEQHADQHEYYTDLGLLKRESLKHHPQIRGLLDQLWEAADKNGDGGLDKEEYMVMCRKVYKAIVDDSNDEEDEAERQRIAEEDWAADSHGHDTLDYRRFTTAWFQLADHWTHDLSITAYCSFLGEIKDTVTQSINGRIVWKDDSDIQHMDIHEDEEEKKPEKAKKVEAPEEEIVVKIVPQKKIKPKPKPVKNYTGPVITKPKTKAVSQQASSMVLQEGNPNDKRRNLARMHSRNGLYTGSTVPPPRGWNAQKSNEWGITFTRIKMESQAQEQEAAKSSMNVRATLSSPPRRPMSPPPHITGAFSPNNSATSSVLGGDYFPLHSEMTRPSTSYHPSASGGFQSSKFRYPQPYDATVGAIGGGFEWSHPVVETITDSSRSGSELLRPSWVDSRDGAALPPPRRPSTAGGGMLSSSSSSSSVVDGHTFQSSSSWNDQLTRPSTASGFLSSQATLTLVPANSFSEMLEASRFDDQSQLYALEQGGGGSSLLKSTNSMGSMMLDYIQSPLQSQKRTRRRKKKKKTSLQARPKTAPGKPREHRFDRLEQHARNKAQGRRKKRSISPSGRRSRKHRSKSPPSNSISDSDDKERKESDSLCQEFDGEATGKVPVTRMRKRSGPSNILSSSGIPQPVGVLEPLIRPMTTGGIRRKKRHSNRPVRVNASGSLFRPSSSSGGSSSSRMLGSLTSSSPSSVLLSSSGDEQGYDEEEYGGSRILDPTDMRGLPSSARNLMHQYTGYDPMASLNEASMSIGGSSIFSSPSRKRRGGSGGGGGGRSRSRGRGGGRGSARSSRRQNKRSGGSSVISTGSHSLNSDFSSMSMSAYMNKLVLPASKKTLRLLKLQESCTAEDIVGVMLAVGVSVAPCDVKLSDVSSKTRLRHASVRFGKYTDYKLALKMLEICNRTESTQRQSKYSNSKSARSSSSSTGMRRSRGTHDSTAKGVQRRPEEVTSTLWGKRDQNITEDDFGPTRLSPLSKLKIPRVFEN